MSTEANVQTVKAFFAAMGQADKEGLLALAAEDIEWIVPGEDWPLVGTHRGHTGLESVLKKASKEVEMTYPKPPEFVGQGDRVLVIGVATGKIKATDRPFKDEWVSTSPFAETSSRGSRSISTRKPWRGPQKRTEVPGANTSRFIHGECI